MNIERITKNDIHHFRKLQPAGWSDIMPIFQYYLEKPFCIPVKICMENNIIGIGAGIVFGNTAWLAHIIVDPEFRGRGIGFAIVRSLLNQLNCGTVSLIATHLGYSVYKKAGFIEQTQYLFFERKTPWKGFNRSGNIIQYTDKYMKDIFILDQDVSGEDRCNLLIDKFINSYVYQKKGKLKGYYLPDLGEGMIVADESEAGIELMKMKYAVSDKAVLPIENTIGINFLKENGFTETLRVTRMVWGRQFSWYPDKLYGRIAGNFG
ncbi:MAG: GNAT family N-acetyltransferase [Desulfobacula sp.]|nr:GNAT family N-acetyltransferase [Desulfobacula sp.]